MGKFDYLYKGMNKQAADPPTEGTDRENHVTLSSSNDSLDKLVKDLSGSPATPGKEKAVQAGKPDTAKANVPGAGDSTMPPRDPKLQEPAAEQKATAGNSLIDKYLPTALKYAPQAAAGMAGFGGIYALLSMLPGAKRRRMLNVLASLIGGAGLAYGADKYLKGRNGTLA